MRTSRAGLLAAVGGLMVATGTGLTLSSAAAAPGDMIDICHETPSGLLVTQKVNMDSIATNPNGHDIHDGDIIPPFTGYAGKNWSAENQAIYANDCTVPGEGSGGENGGNPREVTPQAPTFSDSCGTADDTYTIPSVDHVSYEVNGEAVDAGTYSASGTVTVTADVENSYKLVGADEWSETFTDAPCAQEPTAVSAQMPGVSDPCSTEDDALTIPSVTGVAYQLNGDAVDAGSYQLSGTVSVTAVATEGYQLSEDASWDIVFTDVACSSSPEEPPGDSNEKPRNPGENTEQPGDDNEQPGDDTEELPAVPMTPPASPVGQSDDNSDDSDDGAVNQSQNAPGAGVPTAVDAGLGSAPVALQGGTTGEVPAAGIGLMSGGLMLIAAGGVLAARRRGDYTV